MRILIFNLVILFALFFNVAFSHHGHHKRMMIDDKKRDLGMTPWKRMMIDDKQRDLGMAPWDKK